jgi:putative redox protein
VITVERIAPDGTPHRISIREHDLIADMSEASGGRDVGPDPHDLYDSALGACKALTILWYAKRNDIAVEGITVSVSRDASHERTGRYRLKTRVALTGDMTEAQHAKLIEVAEHCPVQKLMTEVTTEIETVAVSPHWRKSD